MCMISQGPIASLLYDKEDSEAAVQPPTPSHLQSLNAGDGSSTSDIDSEGMP